MQAECWCRNSPLEQQQRQSLGCPVGPMASKLRSNPARYIVPPQHACMHTVCDILALAPSGKQTASEKAIKQKRCPAKLRG